METVQVVLDKHQTYEQLNGDNIIPFIRSYEKASYYYNWLLLMKRLRGPQFLKIQ